MRLLITGATGYIGQYVLREAMQRGHEIVALIHDSPVPRDWNETGKPELCNFTLGGEGVLDLDPFNLDAIIHLAAALSGTDENRRRSLIEGSTQLIDAAKKAKISKIVGIGSIAAIDYVAIPAMSVINEDAPIKSKARQDSSYASLKAEQEVVLSAFSANEANHLILLRPGLVYDDKVLSCSHAGIVKTSVCVLAFHAGSVPLIQVESLAQAIVDAAELNGHGKEVIHLVDDVLPTQSEYISKLKERGGLKGYRLNISWKIFYIIATLTRLLTAIPVFNIKLPELLASEGVASRLKPFQFSNKKARLRFGRDFKSGVL